LAVTNLLDELTKCIGRQWQALRASRKDEDPNFQKFKVHAGTDIFLQHGDGFFTSNQLISPWPKFSSRRGSGDNSF
jgi:hypothetical protein